MSRVIILETRDQLRAFVNQRGYAALIFAQSGDWACDQLTARCASYSREYPHVSFAIVKPTASRDVNIGNTPLSFIPTTVVYRAGKPHAQVIGTDYAQIEKILAESRRDGTSLAMNPVHNTQGRLAAQRDNHAILRAHAKALDRSVNRERK